MADIYERMIKAKGLAADLAENRKVEVKDVLLHLIVCGNTDGMNAVLKAAKGLDAGNFISDEDLERALIFAKGYFAK